MVNAIPYNTWWWEIRNKDDSRDWRYTFMTKTVTIRHFATSVIKNFHAKLYWPYKPLLKIKSFSFSSLKKKPLPKTARIPKFTFVHWTSKSFVSRMVTKRSSHRAPTHVYQTLTIGRVQQFGVSQWVTIDGMRNVCYQRRTLPRTGLGHINVIG